MAASSTAVLSKYPHVVRVNLMSSLMYGKDLAMQAGFMALVLFVFVQLWTRTFATRPADSIAGFTLPDMIWYLVLTETVVLSAPRPRSTRR